MALNVSLQKDMQFSIFLLEIGKWNIANYHTFVNLILYRLMDKVSRTTFRQNAVVIFSGLLKCDKENNLLCSFLDVFDTNYSELLDWLLPLQWFRSLQTFTASVFRRHSYKQYKHFFFNFVSTNEDQITCFYVSFLYFFLLFDIYLLIT